MLSSVEINGFRTFRRLVVESLRRVNLFVGKNNTGKTSLLDALELVSVAMPWGLWRSPLRRGEELYLVGEDDRPSRGRELDLSHLFFGHVLEGSSFTISAINHPRCSVECRVMMAPKDEDSSVQEGLPGVETLRQALAVRFQSDLMSGPVFVRLSPEGGLAQDTRRRLLPPTQEGAPKVGFLRPETVDMRILSQLWDRIVLTPEEDKVIEALRIIEPKIERIASLEGRYGRNTIVLKLSDSEQRLPLGSAGDGLKRLLALSLNLIPLRGGSLFVDEIDTGLHFSVMADMWKLVIETASRLDVQVFATTHSLDCVRALAWMREKLPPRQVDAVMLHRVEKGIDKTISYTMDEIETAARNHLEVR